LREIITADFAEIGGILPSEGEGEKRKKRRPRKSADQIPLFCRLTFISPYGFLLPHQKVLQFYNSAGISLNYINSYTLINLLMSKEF